MAQEKQKQSANQGRGQEQLLYRLKDLPDEKTTNINISLHKDDTVMINPPFFFSVFSCNFKLYYSMKLCPAMI